MTKIFLAGDATIAPAADDAIAALWLKVKRRLFSAYSHANFKTNSITPAVKDAVARGWELFLDSGAFSFVDEKKTAPTLEQYAAFCHKHKDVFSVIAPLDVIGSTGASATATFRNYKRLYDLGVPVHPVYHLFEPDFWLERNLEEVHRRGDNCILLVGGMADKSVPRKRLIDSLDQLFARPDITDEEGRPLVRLHAFGVGDEKLLMKFPFYSADAQSWLTAAIYGGCTFRLDRHGRADFRTVYFSQEALDAGHKPHYGKLSPGPRGHVDSWLAALGLSAEVVAADYQPRYAVNAATFASIEDLCARRYARASATTFDAVSD